MKFPLLPFVFAAAFSCNSFAADATPEQLALFKQKFTAQDCALWLGGSGHQNDNVPKQYSERVEAAFAALASLPVKDAIRTINEHCKSEGAGK